MAKKKKYYVVWSGMEPGVYDNWQDCLAQVKGFPNAKYKSYSTREEAEEAYAGGFNPDTAKKTKRAARKPDDMLALQEVVWDSWSVDAACSGNPGDLEYRGVYTQDGTQIFHQGPFREGTNNIGEFLALVHAIALLKRLGKEDMPVYSDSKIAMGWVRKKQARTKLKRTSKNAALFKLIARAETWLKEHTVNNPILKWDTERWGEIPADFGRK